MTLLESSVSILYRIPAGTPNLDYPFSSEGETRPRVVIAQAAPRAATCFPRCIDLLRIKIGPRASDDMREEQHRETIFEQYKAAYATAMLSLPCFTYWGKTPHGKAILEGITAQNARQQYETKTCLFRSAEDICRESDPANNRVHTDVAPMLERFIAEPGAHINFLTYIQDQEYHTRIRCYKKLILDYNGQQTVADIDAALPISSLDDLQRNTSLYHKAAHYFIGYNLMFTRSAWNPNLPIEGFLDCLKRLGPHIVGGHFGPMYYSEAPIVKGSVGSRNIYGWAPGASAARIPENTTHTVVVIGAAVLSNQNVVYYIDPSDGSDPQNEDLQRIYVSSYKRFCERATALYERGRDEVTYALHHSFGRDIVHFL